MLGNLHLLRPRGLPCHARHPITRSPAHPQGAYRYNTKSKASWYWSRSWGATKRLGCQYYVLTDWQRWAFGVFDDKREHGWVSPVVDYAAEGPSVMQTLFYWAR